MHGHFAEHLVGVLWARPERAFCTCRARAAASRPWVLPTLQSRATHSTAHRITPSSPGALQHHRQSPLAARRRRQRALPWTAPPKPPARASCPLGTGRAYPHSRRHALVAATTPCSYSNGDPSSILSTAAKPAPSCYKRRPRAPPSTQATPSHPHSFPLASNRRGGSFFLVSGQFGRRRAPVQYVAARPSPAHPTPPTVSP